MILPDQWITSIGRREGARRRRALLPVDRAAWVPASGERATLTRGARDRLDCRQAGGGHSSRARNRFAGSASWSLCLCAANLVKDMFEMRTRPGFLQSDQVTAKF